jgi:hypothetical protein
MKKKILHQKLIKSLLNSNFLFLDKKNANHKKDLNFRYINQQSSLIKKQNVVYLDLFESLKDLRQLMRMIFFLKKYSTKRKFHFFIDEEKIYSDSLIENFINIKELKNQDSFLINSHFLKQPNNIKNTINLGFLLGNIFSQDNQKTFFKNQFYRKTFLFSTINIEKELNFGYKIYNDMNDYKKSLFFFSFLRQILKTYAVSKKI